MNKPYKNDEKLIITVFPDDMKHLKRLYVNGLVILNKNFTNNNTVKLAGKYLIK